MGSQFPCPCCGFLTYDILNLDQICAVCKWQDDFISLYCVFFGSAPNLSTLYDWQKNFLQRISLAGLPANAKKYKRDPYWRAIDLSLDRFADPEDAEAHKRALEIYERAPESPYALYYWRPEYWLKA